MMDSDSFSHADGHGEYVAHRMNPEAGFVDTERSADLPHPRLIFGDRAKFAAIQQPGAAVPDARDGNIVFPGLERGYQRGPHAFEERIVLRLVKNAAVGLFHGREEPRLIRV